MTNHNREAGYPASLEEFHNRHSGETCLIIGNGPHLRDLPIDFLHSYPSLGSNTIHLFEEFTPTYYCAVDSRVMREFQIDVMARFASIPKFLPTPNLDKWQGENIFRFYHRPGALWPHGNGPLWPRDMLGETGITYACVTHVLFQLAYFMGFETMLLVGCDHEKPGLHFWGNDEGSPGKPDLDLWAKGYLVLSEGFAPKAKIINISTYTMLPEVYLPRGDWKDWSL